MYIDDIELEEAPTLEEAADALARHAPDVRVLAGGTDLLVDLKTGRVAVGHLVSIRRIEALRGIEETSEGLRIGALTTITALLRSPAIQARYAPLLEAAGRMAAPQIRNVATIGGNICGAVPCADLPPILMTLAASVELWSRAGQRHLPLEAFFTGPRQTVRRHDEVLTAVRVPEPPPGFGAAYARFGLREGNAIAVAAVAAGLRLDGAGTAVEARVVLNAVAPLPKVVDAAARELVGRAPDEAAIARAAVAARQAAQPISDLRGSAGFRRDLVEVMARRALAAAARRARESQA
ncbi:MAG: xanthine dehydrogenase family protein subunit M [Planctomycetes bacterium]|nr:xanthine dehydrogenase family protein subunit M [Planctomycetota bacterium]